MIYKGIEVRTYWGNGSWFTDFSIDGAVIKNVEWRGTFGEYDIREVIDKQIIPFI